MAFYQCFAIFALLLIYLAFLLRGSVFCTEPTMKSQDWELGYQEMPLYQDIVKIPVMRREHASAAIDSKVLGNLNRTSFRHRIAACCNVFCHPCHRTHAEADCDQPKEKLTVQRPVQNKDQLNRRRECWLDSSSLKEDNEVLTDEDLISHISDETLNDDSLYKAISKHGKYKAISKHGKGI